MHANDLECRKQDVLRQKNKGGCDFAATSFVMDSVDFFGVGNRNGVFDVIAIKYINNF